MNHSSGSKSHHQTGSYDPMDSEPSLPPSFPGQNPSDFPLFSETGEPTRQMPPLTMHQIGRAHLRPGHGGSDPNPLSLLWHQESGPWNPARSLGTPGQLAPDAGPTAHPCSTALSQSYTDASSGTGSAMGYSSMVDSTYHTASDQSGASAERSAQSRGARKGRSTMDQMRPPPKKRKPSSVSEHGQASICSHCGQTFRLPSEVK